MEAVTSLVAALALLSLLALTAMRFGVDSREDFVTRKEIRVP